MKTYPRVLTIAGSDSGGGAGIQADIKAISATGSYAASAITAVTVQNTLGVLGVHPVPPECIAAQIGCVLSDIGADAIKIGMLHSAAVVLCVRDTLVRAAGERLAAAPAAAGAAATWAAATATPAAAGAENAGAAACNGVANIVLDPVMVSTSGHRLIEESAIEVLCSELIPMARVITPNIPEAEILAGVSVSSQADLKPLARKLSLIASAGGTRGRVSVLMKAGHLTNGELTDVFYNAEADTFLELPSPRISTPNTHGTGCTLSSAFASYLAQGYGLDDAARAAKEYITRAIESGALYSIGHGHGPVNHFWK